MVFCLPPLPGLFRANSHHQLHGGCGAGRPPAPDLQVPRLPRFLACGGSPWCVPKSEGAEVRAPTSRPRLRPLPSHRGPRAHRVTNQEGFAPDQGPDAGNACVPADAGRWWWQRLLTLTGPLPAPPSVPLASGGRPGPDPRPQPLRWPHRLGEQEAPTARAWLAEGLGGKGAGSGQDPP